MSEQATQAQGSTGTLDLATCTADEFRTEVSNNASLMAEYLSSDNAAKFERINKLLDGIEETGETAGAGVTPNTTTQDQRQQVDPDELTVTLKVKKDQLGSYLKNRSPEEAVLAKLRGKDEADRYIDNLKTTNNQLSNQTVTLQKQLQDAMVKSQAAIVSRENVQALSLPKADELKNVDLFDADGQKKVLDTLSALTEAVTNRASQETAAAEPVKETTQNTVLEQQKIFEQNDRQQIYELQYRHPELSTLRDIFDIDKDVANAYNAMDRLAGGQGGVTLFLRNDAQGQAFRDSCSKAGVSLPSEYDTWYQIMSAREERLNVLNETAKALSQAQDRKFSIYDVTGIPNTSLVDIYGKVNIPESPLSRLEQVIEKHKQERTVAAIPAGTVPEIPQSIMNGQYPADVSLWSESQVDGFLSSKHLSEFTRDEAIIVKAIYESAGMDIPDTIKMKLK